MRYLFVFMLLIPAVSFAQGRTFTYDIGASSGSYNGTTYSEINLGLSWYVFDFLNWRNSIFSRFGSQVDSVTGLDSSARLFYDMKSEGGGLGLHLFAGPGIRISNQQNTGVFGEAGAYFRLAGLTLGVGVKALKYTAPGKDPNGTERPKTDNTVFIVLGGGGAI
jgi:hypothetical protein